MTPLHTILYRLIGPTKDKFLQQLEILRRNLVEKETFGKFVRIKKFALLDDCSHGEALVLESAKPFNVDESPWLEFLDEIIVRVDTHGKSI